MGKCDGGEVASNCDDLCCPPRTWSNETYLVIKGAQSLQHWNEKRIIAAVGALLTPTAGYPNAAEAEAYDQVSQGVKPGFILSLTRAYNNFLARLPPDRWKSQKGVKEGNYEDWLGDPMCGPWSIFYAVGGNVNTSAMAKAIVYVPGGAGNLNVRTMPTYQQIIHPVDGWIAPTPWLESFMKAFRPSAPISTVEKLRRRLIDLKMIRDAQITGVKQPDGTMLRCSGKTPCPTLHILSAIETTKVELVFRLRQSLVNLEMIRDSQIKVTCPSGSGVFPSGKKCPSEKVLSAIAKTKAEIAELAPRLSKSAIRAIIAKRPQESQESQESAVADAASDGGISPAVIVGGLAVVGIGAYFVFR